MISRVVPGYVLDSSTISCPGRSVLAMSSDARSMKLMSGSRCVPSGVGTHTITASASPSRPMSAVASNRPDLLHVRHHRRAQVLEVVLPLMQRRDLPRIDVEPQHRKPRRMKSVQQRQPHVSQPDHPHDRRRVLNLRLQLHVHPNSQAHVSDPRLTPHAHVSSRAQAPVSPTRAITPRSGPRLTHARPQAVLRPRLTHATYHPAIVHLYSPISRQIPLSPPTTPSGPNHPPTAHRLHPRTRQSLPVQPAAPSRPCSPQEGCVPALSDSSDDAAMFFPGERLRRASHGQAPPPSVSPGDCRASPTQPLLRLAQATRPLYNTTGRTPQARFTLANWPRQGA